MKKPAARPSKRPASTYGGSDLLLAALASLVFVFAVLGLFYFIACVY